MTSYKKYKKRLMKATREIRRWQDNHTGTTNTKLSKAQSKAVLDELCPWCEHDGQCEIDTKTYGKIYKRCRLKSWDLQDVWVMVTDDRVKVNIGDKYGLLVVRNYRQYIAKAYRDSHLWWVCQCECGNYVTQRGHNLTTGNTKSCGCLKPGPKKDIILKSITKIEKKKFKYRIGSNVNPDGTRHNESIGHTSKLGCKTEHVVETECEDGRIERDWITDKCHECGSIIRYNNNDEKQCENCGLIS